MGLLLSGYGSEFSLMFANTQIIAIIMKKLTKEQKQDE